MNWDEYKKQAYPGRAIEITFNGEKFEGVAGNMYDASGVIPVVRLNDGIVLKVSEKNFNLVHLKPLH